MRKKFNLMLYNLLQINAWIRWKAQKPFKAWAQEYSEIFSKTWEKYSGDIDKVLQTMDYIENKSY